MSSQVGPMRQTRERLDRAQTHGVIVGWSEHVDETFRNGIYWSVTFRTGPVWKMSRNMVSAFDKALRVSGAYEQALDADDVHALVSFVDIEGRGTNESAALVRAVARLRRLPGGRYVEESLRS